MQSVECDWLVRIKRLDIPLSTLLVQEAFSDSYKTTYGRNSSLVKLFMSTLSREFGGKAFHVGDCYVWSAIYYLDSPTDYRESLPRHGVTPRNVLRDDLITLDSLNNRTSPKVSFCPCVICVLAFVIGALLLYFWGGL
jgi:hypothetical protein